MATELLTDGRGPVYNTRAIDDLTATVILAVEQLNPALPLMHDLIGPEHE